MAKESKRYNANRPVFSADQIVPEITLKAILLSIFITALLAAADMYLGLKVGITIAASIPAAVVAMGIFHFFKKSNVLEINLVQTAASAGEGISTSAAFILPALIILGFWSDFKFWQIMILSAIGGILGVFFSIPLRRVLLNHKALFFPEGTAVGNLLKVRASGVKQMKVLLQGITSGGFIVLAQTGFSILSDHLSLWFKKSNTIFGLSFGLNPALLGIGYIVGFNVGLTIFIGMVLGWILGIPILSHIYGISTSSGNAEDIAMTLWSQHVRYIGVGTMIVGGLWTLVTLFKPMADGLKYIFNNVKKAKSKSLEFIPRTERDIHIYVVLWGVILFLLLCFFAIFYSFHVSHLNLSTGLKLIITVIGVFYILIFGLISSLIAGYIVGLIGSSNAPVSGIFILNLLLLCLFLLPLFALQVDLHVHVNQQAVVAIIIFVLMLVGTATTITLENIQDLKAGYMVGATPWKQQVMLMLGVIVASIIIAPVLHLLFQAYGMGGVFPRPGMDPSQMLSAPQAGLLAALARGAIGKDLPWDMLITGIIIGVFSVIADEWVKRTGKLRLPTLAVGLGIYLPTVIVTCVFLGGIIRFFADRAVYKKVRTFSREKQQVTIRENQQRGILLACGLVAGAALMGVFLAIPFVIKGNSNVLQLVPDSFVPIANVLGVLVIISLCVWLYRTTVHVK